MTVPPRIGLDPPWLEVDLGAPHRVLTWALGSEGFGTARRILWREVRNADLPKDLDARAWLAAERARCGAEDAVILITSRGLDAHVVRSGEAEGVAAHCVATVGLSNAERAGHRIGAGAMVGTVNIAVAVSERLTDAALVEAVSIATQARTVAILEHGPRLATGRASGTGTDCLAVAAPTVGTAPPLAHVGLHTAAGEAIGRAVHDAVAAGTIAWMSERKDEPWT